MRYMDANRGRRGVTMGDSSNELTDDPATSFVPTGGVIHFSPSQFSCIAVCRAFCRLRARITIFGRVGARLSQGAESVVSASQSIVDRKERSSVALAGIPRQALTYLIVVLD
jgi:hypothetical protein